MSDELVDVVDVYDNFLREELKSVCHNNNLLHRGSGIFLFKDKNLSSFLLQKRSNKMRKSGLWCHHGGHVKAGESYENAAIRELKEELFSSNQSIQEIRLYKILKTKKTADNDYEIITLFGTVFDGQFFADDNEIEDLKFFGVKEVADLIIETPEIFTGTFIDLYTKFLKLNLTQLQ